MGVPCWALKSAMPSSQLGKFVDDSSLHSHPRSTFQYWRPVEKEASLPVLTWFLHVRWPKCVLSSAIRSYHQILVGKSSGNSQNCFGVVCEIPLNNNLKDHITHLALGFLCGNLWLLEGALCWKESQPELWNTSPGTVGLGKTVHVTKGFWRAGRLF